MWAASLCPPRRNFRNALDEVQRRQHQHLFRFGLNPEEVTLLELPKNVGEQLLRGVVAHGVSGDLRLQLWRQTGPR